VTIRYLVVLAILFAAACGSPASPPIRAAAPVIHDRDMVGSAVRAGTDASSLAQCPAAAAQAARIDLAAFEERLQRAGDAQPAAPLRGHLRAVTSSSCLAHVAATVDFAALAALGTVGEVHDLWRRGFGDALVMDAGGIGRRNTRRVWAVPPEPRPPLDAQLASALGPWLCSALDATCTAAAEHVARAEAAFDRFAGDPEHAPHVPSCVPSRTPAARDGGPTPWQSWVSCVTDAAPRAARYPSARFRAPERGWLIVGGRRGHYDFMDELRAFDLATGAAYVASTTSARAQPSRKRASVRGRADDKAASGRVETDRARELAFALVTARAVRSIRVHASYVDVPEGLEVDIGAADEEWRSGHLALNGDSSRTTIRWVMVDQETVSATGELVWPSSTDPADDNADDLMAAVEATFVPGCAPAGPPPQLGLDAAAPSALPEGIDPSERGAQKWLSRRLAGLHAPLCR
jgi:hypothetical protein